MEFGYDPPVTIDGKGDTDMVIRDMFGAPDDVKNEVDEVFRFTGSIYLSGSRCFPVSVEERKYIFMQFGGPQAYS